MTFESVDTAVKLIKPHSWLAKVDLKSAYRHVGLHPSEFQATGLKYKFSGDDDFTYFYDTRLPFGASRSVGCFSRITQSVVRMFNKQSKCKAICYLDDFLIISNSKSECLSSMNTLIQLLQGLGFTINYNKVIPPARELTFLGINISCAAGTLSIPHDKLQDIQQSLLTLSAKCKASKRELQSAIGKVSWAAKCVRAVRPMLRCLIDMVSKLKKPTHRARIPTRVKSDIRYFCDWCVKFNGVALFPKKEKPLPYATVYTDASLQAGAAYCHGDFLYSSWEADFPQISPEPIFVKETLSVLLAFRRWAPIWAGHTVHVYTDNKGTEWALRKCLTRNCLAIDAIRELLWIAAYSNIAIVPHYVSTKDNYIADALSRMHDLKFQGYIPDLLFEVGINVNNVSFNWLNHMSLNSLLSFHPNHTQIVSR